MFMRLTRRIALLCEMEECNRFFGCAVVLFFVAVFVAAFALIVFKNVLLATICAVLALFVWYARAVVNIIEAYLESRAQADMRVLFTIPDPSEAERFAKICCSLAQEAEKNYKSKVVWNVLPQAAPTLSLVDIAPVPSKRPPGDFQSQEPDGSLQGVPVH